MFLFKTALAHHGWIPEAVYATASIAPGRKSHEVTNPSFGRFAFHPLAINRPAFLELIYRHDFDGQAAFVATPARALLDLVCFRKIEWRGLDWIEDGLRIDPAHILTIRKKDYATLKSVYKHKAVIKFLHELEKAAAAKRAGVRTGAKS